MIIEKLIDIIVCRADPDASKRNSDTNIELGNENWEGSAVKWFTPQLCSQARSLERQNV